jgi:hypothetical protein
MEHEATPATLGRLTRRTLLVKVVQGALVVVGASTLAAIGETPGEALAKQVKEKNNKSNTKKKKSRKVRSNPRKGTDNKKDKNDDDD